ncbi:hypothetical protein SY86_09855 [Erwinia tracheiphila]|uniref:Uncharacterized protein n=1 Tax=Erwinia tracheiphila TaxID=65700 RepID=A0A0M2K9Q0_9GAMM|nr:hypothetical protein SY86_09855 [Erwinia tracheiphila]
MGEKLFFYHFEPINNLYPLRPDLTVTGYLYRCLSDYIRFMVRKLNHRFKNFLTMSSSVCNAVMMCHRERYGHKMAFAARF